ncbi:MAG: RodZ domain-containing protein [Pseudomonadota bacterium]
MIGFRSKTQSDQGDRERRGFDDFELRLGDVMRGERATLGKSLLDVERELRIKASYIAAIENCDPDAFDTPGFIPGYVRSYARYLDMDPDQAFDGFCRESGFHIAHGMSAEASSIRRPSDRVSKQQPLANELGGLGSAPFVPARDSLMSRIEPGALGSMVVLMCLIGGLGYGGWSVLNEVQRVQFAPIENTPNVLSDLDPLQAVVAADQTQAETGAADAPEGDPAGYAIGEGASPRDDRLDRLFRPEALDVPVLVARDAPISTLDPAEMGAYAGPMPQTDRSPVSAAVAAVRADVDRPDINPTAATAQVAPKVLAEQPTPVRMIAVRPAWVRVRAADGSVIFEGILNAGDTYDVPVTEDPATLRVGESGAIYFAMNGQHYGPAGPKGTVTSGLTLDSADLLDTLQVADLEQDQDLSRYVAELSAGGETSPDDE